MEKISINDKINDITYWLIKLAAYIILPLIAMVSWIIGSSAVVCGGVTTSVDSMEGIIPTIIVFSLPMVLFLAAIPLYIKHRSERKGLDNLGLIYKNNETNTTISIVNLGILACVIIRFLTIDNIILTDAISMIIHMVAIGISEEILLRVVVYDEIHKKFNTILSVIITSLIFAFVYHSGCDWQSNLFIRFPLGVILSILRIKTDSVYNSVITHTWYNMFVLTI